MNKKLIIIASTLGIVGFAGTFAAAWFTRPAPPLPLPAKANAQIDPSMNLNTEQMAPTVNGQKVNPLQITAKKTMTERQLKGLIYEIRTKINDYEQKNEEIEIQETRITAARQELQNDIAALNNLRTELATAVTKLKAEQNNLMKSKIEIAKIEKANLRSIAGTYDKMDATSAGTILTNMAQSQSRNANPDDAIKILFYMTERTKAKVLASIAQTEPGISAYFCQKLKRIIETK